MSRLRHRRLLIPVVALGVVGLVLAALLFQPWLLFVDSMLDEAAPVVAPASARPTVAQSSSAPAPSATPRAASVLSTGRLISHEHETSGQVKIIELADGRRVLRIEDLATTTGPDLRVWLSSGPVVEGRAGWFVFDDHPYVELGKLKANRGNQNYSIPASADLGELTSVAIWCKRFSVSFGAAALDAA